LARFYVSDTDWYLIGEFECNGEISTVIKVTINAETVVCAPSHDFGVEMDTGIHITKVAYELHRAAKFPADFCERRFICIKLVENILHMLF
jgi:hypothetical protein